MPNSWMKSRIYQPSAIALLRAMALAVVLLLSGGAWAQPANDNIANAVELTGASGTVSGSNISATAESDEPSHAGQTARHSVWYRWTAPEGGAYDFSTCTNTSFNTVLAAYRLTSDTMALVTANDNWCDPYYSSIRLNAERGEAFLIALDGNNGLVGNFTITYVQVENPPANDNFADATVIPALPFVVDMTNINASLEYREFPQLLGPRRTVWYRWTAPANMQVTAQACTGDFIYRLVGIFQGTSADSLVSVNWAYANCGSGGATTEFQAVAGETYYIDVESAAGIGGNFRLVITGNDPPANDNIASAAVLQGATGSVSTSTRYATAESGEPTHAGSAASHSIWYRWIAPQNGAAQFSTCQGTSFDTVLAAYRGTTETLSLVNANDDWCGSRSDIQFSVNSGETYWIAIDGRYGARGDVTLSYSMDTSAPLNDDFDDAIVISGMSFVESGYDNRNATFESNEPDHGGTPGKSVWFRWSSPDTGNAAIDVCQGTSFQRTVAIYTGTTLESLVPVSAQTTRCGAGAYAVFPATAGETYSIAVDSLNEGVGSFGLSLRLAVSPPNDFVANAQLLEGSSGYVDGNNTYATGEPGESGWWAPYNSLWYRWVAPGTGVCIFDTCQNSVFDTTLGIYTGSPGAFSSVAWNDDWCGSRSRIDLPVVRGTTYWISVDGYYSSTGSFRLSYNYQGVPDNDAFVGAQILTGESGSLTGSNQFATAEPGEPAHAGNTAAHSLWYRWVAPADGAYDFSTCTDTNFDTVLAAYTGTTETLTMVAANDNWCNTQSSLRIRALEGETYWIALDGRGTSTGTFYDGRPFLDT